MCIPLERVAKGRNERSANGLTDEPTYYLLVQARNTAGTDEAGWGALAGPLVIALAPAPTSTPTPAPTPLPTHTPTSTPVPTPTPSSSASLSPDPSTVSFQPNGEWHEFTVNSSGLVKVVANPSGSEMRVEITQYGNSANFCPPEQNDSKTRSNGQSVYLAGCTQGTGTVELHDASDDSVIRTYTFTIGTPQLPPPTGLNATATDDDISVSFTPPTTNSPLSTGTTRNTGSRIYRFDLHSSDTQHGVFASVLQLTTLSSPIDFNDRTRGQWYKVKGQTCDETTIGQPIWTCGNWSDWSSTIELPLQLTPTPVPPYLWPDPSTVTFQADGTWHEFTVTSNTDQRVKVVANPRRNNRRVEISANRTGVNVCPPEWIDPVARNVGEHVYLAGCHSGTGVVELWDASDDSFIRAYAFTINPGPTTATASSAPNVGDLYYGGSNHADAYFSWDNPSWLHDDADCDAATINCSTYEHDLKLEWSNDGGWFDSLRIPGIGRLPPPTDVDNNPFCSTVWSNLPQFYNDCETAGVDGEDYQEDGLVELGIGTFKAPLIEAGQAYYSSWTFANLRGTGSSTQVGLGGQEGYYARGPILNYKCVTVTVDVWCVEGIDDGRSLTSTSWTYGSSNYVRYPR